MTAIIEYVKGTMMRKMSCYCGYMLCATTILKNNEVLYRQCSYLIEFD